MEELKIDSLKREEARNLIVKLPRNKEFVIDKLSDGRRIFIRTDGVKESKVDEKLVKDIDITVHFDNEPKRKISYVNDILVPLIKKEGSMGENNIKIVVDAVKDVIELVPLKEVIRKYPEVEDLEFLLALIKALSLQEDVNYWGTNPKTNKRYEGRYKPYDAICDLLIKKMPLTHITRKHILY
jgi:hypothetical protein